jgi:hypothetical protein
VWYVEEVELARGFQILADRTRALPKELGVLRVAVEAQHLELLATWGFGRHSLGRSGERNSLAVGDLQEAEIA